MELINQYFDGLTPEQIIQFQKAIAAYKDWNAKINVVSRKNIDHLEEHHFLHSLALSKFLSSQPQDILDVGCGGGFPGIPLSILYPQSRFMLVDSIAKKIKVVNAVAQEADLSNAKGFQMRAEEVENEFDIILSRAVAPLKTLISWNVANLKDSGQFLLLKGGDLTEEIQDAKQTFPGLTFTLHPLSEQFQESFFETKSVIQASLHDWVRQEPA
jgi:16S rRNA (guanine527-N7)-methyltransferase